jgi:hypothetical protein
MNSDSCETCFFWREKGRRGKSECHASAPMPDIHAADGDYAARWPEVPAEEWCGEHQVEFDREED